MAVKASSKSTSPAKPKGKILLTELEKSKAHIIVEIIEYMANSVAQIIEGKAEIVIDKVSTVLNSGEGIIIPAHAPNFIKPNGRFKMILTIIKSGYE